MHTTPFSTAIAIFAVVVLVGAIIGIVAMFLITTESAAAWHDRFESRKECVNYYRSIGNTTAVANIACQK